MQTGLVVDVETTGLDPAQDRVIEVGLVEFAWETGKEPHIVSSYGALEDPQQPISPEVSAITGLTDAIVAGRTVDWPRVRRYFERASLIVAHNMEFDRGFLMRMPALEDLELTWACSLNHIDWGAKGFRSRALNYLAADHGFLNPFAHRAIFDCATTFRLIAPHLDEMVRRSQARQYRFAAVGAPFEKKDELKRRGYRWQPDERVWWRRVFSDECDAERDFLATHIYGGASRHQEQELN